jgi:hypothetical protein
MQTRYRYTYLTIIVFLIVLMMTFYCHGIQPVPTKLLRAIHKVETGGKIGPILGDNGKALGPFQIHYGYWKDANVRGSYSDCKDYNYSVMVVTAYLNRYALNAVRTQDSETLARVHNGGPRGHMNINTKIYWKKVRNHLTNKQA